MEKIITTIDGTYVIEKGVLTGFGQLEGMKGSRVLESKVADEGRRDSILTPGVKEIGSYAFCCCEGLRKVHIHPSIEVIRSNAFYSCNDLKDPCFYGSHAKKIESHAFSWCAELEQVDLPPSLEHIAKDAFSHCFNLKKINMAGDNPRYFSMGGVLYERTKDGERVVIDPKDCRD